MIIKIFSKDIVDCSSSVNMLAPNPESNKILLELIWNLCNSEAVESIVNHSLQLSLKTKKVGLISTEGHTFGSSDWYKNNFHLNERKYPLRSGDNTLENKINGLFIASPLFKNNLSQHNYMHYNDENFIVPAGLSGLRKSLNIIKSMLIVNDKSLPKNLQGKDLAKYEFNVSLVWKAWSDYKEIVGIGKVQCGDLDNIWADSERMELQLGGICKGGHQGRPNGDKHFADIQRVFNQFYPEYTIKEVGESPSDSDGRKRLYQDAELEEIEYLEPPDIFYGQEIDAKEKKTLIRMQKILKTPLSNEGWNPGFKTENGIVVKIGLSKIDVNDVIEILEEFKSLEQLILSECTSIESNIGALKFLKTLEILRCIDFEGSFDFFNNLTNLSRLKIVGSHKLYSFSSGISNLKSLKNLEISFCDNLNSFSKNIIELPLTKLIISHCRNLENYSSNNRNSSLTINEYLSRYTI